MSTTIAKPAPSGAPGSPLKLVTGLDDLVATAPAAGLHLKAALPWSVGPKGRDSAYALQGLGWPWARTADGRDLFTGLRLSTVGDGSCYYHAVYKAVGTLRNLATLVGGEDSPPPFFVDEAFVTRLDYLDVDYRDPEALFAYIRYKMPEAKYLVDTYTHRQYLVDTWRNDIYRWFLRPAINPNTEDYYTEEEATIALNSDVRNMRMWIKEDALNPNVVKITTTNAEASRLLDLLMGGDAPIIGNTPQAVRKMELANMEDVYSTLIGKHEIAITRMASVAVSNIRGYISNTVVNSTATDRMERAVMMARQLGRSDPIGEGMVGSLYTDTEATMLVSRLLEHKEKGLIGAITRCLDVIARSIFYDEVLNAYTTKLQGKEMLNALKGTDFHVQMQDLLRNDVVNELKTGNPTWFAERLIDYIKGHTTRIASIHTEEDINRMQEVWTVKLMTIGPERLPYLDTLIDEEVKIRMGPDAIREKALYFFNQQDWGILAPLVLDEKQSPAHVLVFIDKQLVQPGAVGYIVKQLFRDRLTGNYLKAIENYIDARFALLTLIKAQCGFNYNMFTYEPYATARLNELVSGTEQGWELLGQSINRVTQRRFTPAEVDALKFRDPRIINIDRYPLACKFVDQGGFYERTDELDPTLMDLPININYFMADHGFHLRAQVYESSLESISNMVPVTHGRQDAGEDILPWMSRLLGLNVHVVHCYGTDQGNDLVWLYRSYVSDDLDVEVPGSPHIFINNVGHYEVFGIVDGITTFFNADHAFVAAFRQFIPATTVGGVRLNVEEAFSRLSINPPIPTPIVPVHITSLLKGDESAIELHIHDEALFPHHTPHLPLPVTDGLPRIRLPPGFGVSPSVTDIPNARLTLSGSSGSLPLPKPPGEFGGGD